ncbi:MAG: LysM peptidoglycan-binding domain-containing protein [Anaerocolumna sp.]
MKISSKLKIFVIGALLSFTICTTSVSAATYKVRQGDSLYKISKLFKTSVSTIKKTNNLKSSTLKKGQKLKISARIYTVKSNDTLYKIAKKHKISLANLRAANNKWNNTLKVGQKLIIPGVKPKKTTSSFSSSSSSSSSSSTSSSSSSSSSKISYTQAELDLLARLITAEATGQPYKAMVSVGAVVVNRVQSKEWPNSISKVINHVSAGYYQFSPVKNGYIKKAASKTAIKAAKKALAGTDPTNGAIFYYDDSSTNTYLLSKKVAAQFDRMIFAY